jgi:hypothetical protein
MDCKLTIEFLMAQNLAFRDLCECGTAVARHQTNLQAQARADETRILLIEAETRHTESETRHLEAQRRNVEEHRRKLEEQRRLLEAEEAVQLRADDRHAAHAGRRTVPLSSMGTEDLNLLIEHFELGPTQIVNEFPFALNFPAGLDFGEFNWTLRESTAPYRIAEDEDLSIENFCVRIGESLRYLAPNFLACDVHDKNLFRFVLDAEETTYRGKTDLVFVSTGIQLREANNDVLRAQLRMLIEAKTNQAFAGDHDKMINQATAEFLLGQYYSQLNMVHACLTTGRVWIFFWLANHNDRMCVHRCELELNFTNGILHVAALLNIPQPADRLFAMRPAGEIGNLQQQGPGRQRRARGGEVAVMDGGPAPAVAAKQTVRAEVGIERVAPFLYCREVELSTTATRQGVDCDGAHEDDDSGSTIATDADFNDYADVEYENIQRFLRATMRVAECDFLRPCSILTSESLLSHNAKASLMTVKL